MLERNPNDFFDSLIFHLAPQSIGLIAIKYGSDIHAHFRMNCDNLGDPPSGPKIYLSNILIYDQIPAKPAFSMLTWYAKMPNMVNVIALNISLFALSLQAC